MGRDLFPATDWILESRPSPLPWSNLGYWTENTQNYQQAGHALCQALADFAKIGKKQNILDLGFGYGASLKHWLENHAAKKVIGLNISKAQTEFCKNSLQDWIRQNRLKTFTDDYRTLPPDSYSLKPLTLPLTESKIESDSFDFVVSLDAAYHFADRKAYWQKSWSELRPGGWLAVCDLVMDFEKLGWWERFKSQLVCKLAHIPKANQLGLDAYQAQLANLGFQDIQARDISGSVFPGFQNFSNNFVKTHAQVLKRTLLWKYHAVGEFLFEKNQMGAIKMVLIKAQKPEHSTSPT